MKSLLTILFLAIAATGYAQETDPVLPELTDQYLAVKDALAGDDYKAAQSGVEKLQSLADTKSEAVGQKLSDAIGKAGKAEDIKQLRAAFKGVSDLMIVRVKEHGLQGKTLYLQFCPMAFGNEGAYWISDKEEIRNPYYGSMMLKCGMVKETLGEGS